MPWHCRFCDQYFRKRNLLDEHINALHKSKLDLCHACEICGERFAWFGDLKSHVSVAHSGPALKEEPNAQCETCGKMVKRLCLKGHLLTHSTEKPFSCRHCGFAFVTPQLLNVHLRTHSDERKFACPLCEKRFKWSKARSAHVRAIHGREKPWSCKFCDKSFSNRTILKNHVQTHTKEQPHRCTVCGRRFGKVERLKDHLRTHTKEKPFSCAKCGRAFARKMTLKYHDRRCAATKVLPVEPNKTT